jgi:hypothetical protein
METPTAITSGFCHPCARPPVIKLAAVAALVATSNRPPLRSTTGAAPFAYYSAAVTFLRPQRDSATEAAPAGACGILAGMIV